LISWANKDDKPMLTVSSYAQDYVDACRAKVAAQLASHRKVLAAKPSEIDAFERQFFNHMILVLDHYFVHRDRTMEARTAIRSTRCGCCAMGSWKRGPGRARARPFATSRKPRS
jgi:hypothetical protein